ncbi:MAG: hypothetical protein NVS1B14_07280 [Vulcanimicrobiaceae bacterium]
MNRLLALLLVLMNVSPTLASPVPAGNGSTVFGNVPVAPASFPDYSKRSFAIRGNRQVRPQAIDFGNPADAPALLRWYRAHLPQYGWEVTQQRANYPGRGNNALIAVRTGAALTIVVQTLRIGSRVTVIKLNSSR